MRNIITAFILTICAATTLPAQFVQGTLQGGPPAPGTKSRSPLNSLERAASNRYGATIMTDSFGNQRFTFYVSIWDTCLTYNPETDPVVGGPISVFVRKCETDSIWYIDYNNDVFFLGVTSGGGGPVENWYTVNDTTTDVTRTAYILQNAEWRTVDPTGYLDMTIGDLSYGQLYLDANESSLYHVDIVGGEFVRANANGVQITTTNAATRAVDITTDTMNWASSFDQARMTVNYLAESTYMYADSLKILSIGQFHDVTSILQDGTDKGFFYKPSDNLITIINGDGVSGGYSNIEVQSTNSIINAYKITGSPIKGLTTFDTTAFLSYQQYRLMEGEINNRTSGNGGNPLVQVYSLVNRADPGPGSTFIVDRIIKDSAAITDGWNVGIFALPTDSVLNIPHTYMGYNIDFSLSDFFSSRYAFGVQNKIGGADSTHFDFIKIYLDEGTFANSINFYGDKYQWSNTTPSAMSGDTVFHFWAGNGAGTDPGFITLDQVCAHCAADAVNWYNSNGTTTDNTRIATVTETATWLSTDGELDGVFPFRFELEDGAPNEPEMMVWLFPNGDSLALQQSDVEIQFHTNNDFSSWADGIYSMRADSTYFTSNSSGVIWKVTDNEITSSAQRLTQSVTTNVRQNVIEFVSITGTAQTELTMPTTGSVLNVANNTAANFEIHLTAVCSAAGNGVGISAGESYAAWSVGGIKNIGGTTSLIGTVQTPATAQSDAGMSTSVVTVDANNTNDSLRIRFTPPSTAGTTTVIKVVASIEFTQTSY